MFASPYSLFNPSSSFFIYCFLGHVDSSFSCNNSTCPKQFTCCFVSKTQALRKCVLFEYTNIGIFLLISSFASQVCPFMRTSSLFFWLSSPYLRTLFYKKNKTLFYSLLCYTRFMPSLLSRRPSSLNVCAVL